MNLFRRRLLEAIMFFADNLNYPTKTMMYKVLAELDFRHFKETGMTVTGLEYEAYRFGPVPREFHDEITTKDDLIIPNDFAEYLASSKEIIEFSDGKKHPEFKYHTKKRKADLKVFSPRQQKILVEVADIYRPIRPTLASDASHEPGTPWDLTVKKKGKGAIIEPEEVIELEKPLTKEGARGKSREVRAYRDNYLL